MTFAEELQLHIDAAGGRERLAHAIEVEWLKMPKKFEIKNYDPNEVQYLRELLKRAAQDTGRSPHSLVIMLQTLLAQKRL